MACSRVEPLMDVKLHAGCPRSQAGDHLEVTVLCDLADLN